MGLRGGLSVALGELGDGLTMIGQGTLLVGHGLLVLLLTAAFGALAVVVLVVAVLTLTGALPRWLEREERIEEMAEAVRRGRRRG